MTKMRVYYLKGKKKIPLIVETNLMFAIPYWESQMILDKNIVYTIE
jgi:hypothetical protein